MTANDNIRHYIGDLDSTEDIDLVFKHIFDLMLANGGEGSGLNADMIDGYHASDFAPASIAQELDNCIHSIYLGGNKYEGEEITINLLAKYISIEKADEVITVEDYLNELNNITLTSQDSINQLQNVAEFLQDDETRDVLSNFINNNIQYVFDDEGYREYYLDADSVNGLSFMLVTQEQYDLLPKDRKEDPHNIFIINNDLDTDFSNADYVPPSILKASMDMQYRINSATKNIEFSIDGGRRWSVLLPLVGNSTNKGLLYPEWFSTVNNTMRDESLLNQDDYPFLLNIEENTSKIDESISGIQFDDNTIITTNPQDNNGVLNISEILDSYMTTWINDNRSYIQSKLTIPSISGLENTSNKVTSQTGITQNEGSDTRYPTTKAVVEYVTPIRNGLQSSITSINNKITDTGWQNITAFQSTFKKYSDYYQPQVRRIGKIVHIRGAITRTSNSTAQVLSLAENGFIAMLPDGFAPSKTENFVQQGSGNYRWLMQINKDGEIGLSRYSAKGTYVEPPKDVWLNLHCTYFIG